MDTEGNVSSNLDLTDLAVQSYIRQNSDAKKAPSARLPLRQCSPKSTAAKEYGALTDEMLAHTAQWES